MYVCRARVCAVEFLAWDTFKTFFGDVPEQKWKRKEATAKAPTESKLQNSLNDIFFILPTPAGRDLDIHFFILEHNWWEYSGKFVFFEHFYFRSNFVQANIYSKGGSVGSLVCCLFVKCNLNIY